MSTPRPPITPAGYQQRINSRAANAAQHSTLSKSQLIGIYYYRRLLARVFTADPGYWTLKGGQALLARWPTARYSTDIDLLREGTLDEAVRALISAANTDLDDHLRFAHKDTSMPTEIERLTRKVRFRAMVGNRELHVVSVDVVAGDTPSGVVSTSLESPFGPDGEPWPPVRMFPLEDHTAEKICAMYELHGHSGAASSRYKDLVDLMVIAHRSTLNGPTTHAVLQAEARRRQHHITLRLPSTFTLPDRSWTSGYGRFASRVHELPRELHTLSGARPLIEAFLNPLLGADPPPGHWVPEQRRWAAER
ncbi:nucleotidyl transferase AbiEii/AbiGii toxin family protein [Sciscionella marina]|uniref:nucleotidyl transferase AbiEii/AbiGii toxin family protein n=1 Tax=Sciscionella marina TaxID=508770 RepID=UPI0003689018|nr:nucleotidyl transferase AbiEii/AbiGii toxin family protein [Sciscionella marina]